MNLPPADVRLEREVIAALLRFPLDFWTTPERTALRTIDVRDFFGDGERLLFGICQAFLEVGYERGFDRSEFDTWALSPRRVLRVLVHFPGGSKHGALLAEIVKRSDAVVRLLPCLQTIRELASKRRALEPIETARFLALEGADTRLVVEQLLLAASELERGGAP
jgi:hypothetical protein